MDAPLEPWLADLVEAALSPYRDKLAADDLAWMREELAQRLREEAELSRLADGVRGGPLVDESGQLTRQDILGGEAPPAAAPEEGRVADVVAIGGRRRG